MGAIFRRELRAFFTNPLGYIVLAIFWAIAGFMFFSANLSIDEYVPYGRTDLSPVFDALFYIVLLCLPFLTMRLFSEEKRQKTDQALFTAPTGLTAIVLGKFFATLVLFIITLSITLVFALVIALQPEATVDWMLVIGNYLGLALVSGMIIAIGVFISALTESQMVAAMGTLAVSVLLMFIDGMSSLFSGIAWLTSVTNFLSISARYSTFTAGLIYYDNVIFFLSLQALFLFLTVRVLDSKRWN